MTTSVAGLAAARGAGARWSSQRINVAWGENVQHSHYPRNAEHSRAVTRRLTAMRRVQSELNRGRTRSPSDATSPAADNSRSESAASSFGSSLTGAIAVAKLKRLLALRRAAQDQPATWRPSDDGLRPALDLDLLREQVSRSMVNNFGSRGCRILLDPRTSAFLNRWDVLTSLALVYTSLITPFEISFLTSHVAALFVINRLVDGVFVRLVTL